MERFLKKIFSRERPPKPLPILLMRRTEEGGYFVARKGTEYGNLLEMSGEEIVIFNTASLLRSQVFISGALTGADVALPVFYEGIGEICQKYNLPPYIPHLSGTSPQTNPDLTPTPVVRINRKAVNESGLMIAVLEPSLGVGRELETACREGIPVILIKRRGIKVSRAGRGDLFVVGEVEMESYSSEALPLVEKALVEWLREKEKFIEMFRKEGYEI